MISDRNYDEKLFEYTDIWDIFQKTGWFECFEMPEQSRKCRNG